MSADPPAPDLGAIRARLRKGERLECWSPSGNRLVAHVLPSDLDALLAAYDVQAARLAAVETLLREYHAAAFLHDEDADEHRSDDCLFGFQAISHRAEHLLGLQDRCPCDGAVGAGEARDGGR